MSQKTLLILLHGIRTDAEWHEKVASRFADNPDFDVIPIKYGRFDPVRFWCPVLTRSAKIEEINTRLQNALRKYATHRKVIIAHSFGTYALACIMRDNPLVTFDRIILCGSIVPEGFSWDNVQDQVVVKSGTHIRDYITNECGARDIWPILAQSTTFGFGATGTFGFGVAEVRDRYHNSAHSDYFEDRFIEDFWMPLIQSNKHIASVWERSRPKTPLAHQFLRFPFKFAVPVLLGALLYAVSSAAHDYLYDYSGMLATWQDCNAHLVYPTRIYDLVPSDRDPKHNMLVHKDGEARVYMNAWREADGLSVQNVIDRLRKHGDRDVTLSPGNIDVVSGKLTEVDGKRKQFYYRFRSGPMPDGTRLIKMFEHIMPDVSPDNHRYWNANHIISASFFNYGSNNSVSPSCAWPDLKKIEMAAN